MSLTDDPVLTTDRFEVRQRFKMSTNAYDVRVDGRTVGWARQKIMALKERIEIWRDDSKGELLCAVQARKKLDLGGAYDVLDANGQPIAVLRKSFKSSLVRSTWQVEDHQGELLATVAESNMLIAVVRRIKGVVDVIPFIGWLLALIPIPFHFDWIAPDGRKIGRYQRVIAVRDRYTLDLTGDADRCIDRRAAIAMAICLDALQGR